ncbi:hypothetical protein, partial [Streptomyces sp. NPDC006463]|uniref:hypothetical protein n=1 Tax=Streptomyces sp. NPDC006463 TaxID=3364746 RepID=UPI003678A50F
TTRQVTTPTESPPLLLTSENAALKSGKTTTSQGEARRTATALRLAADKQILAVRFHQAAPPANGATTDVAAAAWNLLVAFAGIWHDHPEFPADAARETFEFDCDAPL